MDDGRLLRREGFLDPEALERALQDPGQFDLSLIEAHARAVFGDPGALTTRVLVQEPGEAVSPLLPDEAAFGFLLDLAPPDWRSEWGGLLLLQGEEERVRGFRPVPGALTLFSSADRPLISLITPGGGRRTSILGWWR